MSEPWAGSRAQMSSGSERSTSLSWVETLASAGVKITDELLVQMHARGAHGKRILVGDPSDHREGVVLGGHRCRRQVQENSVGVDQADGVAVAHEGNRRAFDDGDAQLVGQQAHDGRMLHPGQLFQCRAALRPGG